MSSKARDFNTSGKRDNPLSLYLDIAMALCAAFALVLDLNVRSGNNYVNWAASMPNTPVVPVLFAALLYVMRKANGKLPRLGLGTGLLSMFLGFWWVLAVSVSNTMDVNQPFLTSGQLLKTGVMTLGMAALYQLFFRLLLLALDEGAVWKTGIGAFSFLRWFRDAYRRHTVLTCMAVILAAWLGHFVLAYPCAMNGDSVAQLREWVSLNTYSSHHPPFGTMLIGRFYEAGLLLGDGGIGLAMYVAAQMVLCAAVLGYMQETMLAFDAPLWLRLLSLFSACVCPVYADNITVIIKDVPYAYGMLLVLCETAKCLFLREKATPAGVLRLLAGGLFVMLMRNNGKYVLIPLTICMIVWAAKQPKARAAAACAMAASIALSMGIQAWMMQAYGIVPGSPAEALSLPFQQTARFVRDHEMEIPQEERDAIDAVIGISGLGRAYDPVICDPVKARFRDGVTPEDMQRYFAVWFKQFGRDPLCYVKATLIQNILLLNPQTNNLAIFTGTGIDAQTKETLQITEPDTLRSLRLMEENLRGMLLSLPGMAQLNSLGFHCCVLLFACLWAARRKQGRLLVCLLPLVISMLVIVAGPCIQNQDRYGFPIVYCMPLVLSCMSYVLRKKKGCCEVSL